MVSESAHATSGDAVLETLTLFFVQLLSEPQYGRIFMNLLETAKRLAELAEEEARRMNVPITISVVDIHGNIVLKHRMPGALLISIEMSERKAYTSASLHMRTEKMTSLVQPGQPLYALTSTAGGRYVALGGGVPLRDGEEFVAGVGVSGGTTEQDIVIVEAACRRLDVAELRAATVMSFSRHFASRLVCHSKRTSSPGRCATHR